MSHSLTRTLLVAASLALASPVLGAKDQLRADVGRPLQEAQALIKDGKPDAALRKIDEAQRIDNLSEYETFVVTQMRGAALSSSGRSMAAAGEYEKVLAANRLPPGEALQVRESLIGIYLRAKQYDKAIRSIETYRSKGGGNPEVFAYLPQAYYLSGDYKRSAAETVKLLAQREKSGQRPSESLLRMLASSYAKLGDMQGYTHALEQMLANYPKPEYWADVIERTARKPGFSRKLDLDKLRLLRATGNLKSEAQYMEMAQLALQANLPGEAAAVVNEGLKTQVLGQGDERSVERLGRLRKLISERSQEDAASMPAADGEVAAASTGDPLVSQGMAYVTYGEFKKGLNLIEQGIAKGQLDASDTAFLQLGYAHYLAGNMAQADKAFRQVEGDGGAGDLARLWRIALKS